MFKNNRLRNSIKLAIAGIMASAIAGNIKTTNNQALAQSQLKVVASHNVICDLLDTIAQETIELTCLLDGDRDPHAYRPTPGDRKKIEQAGIVFYGGYQLEPQISELLTEIEVPKIALYEQVVTEPIMAEHKHGGHEDHEGHEGHEDHEDHEGHEDHNEAGKKASNSELEPDPHVWHNVENTVKMVDVINSLFLQANPDAAEQYLVNSNALTEKFCELDAWIKDQIATIPAGKRVLVTTHDALNYYVQAYNLEGYETLQGLSAESAPTASQVRKLSEQIKAAGIPTIFAESTANDRVIRNVAKAADVELSEQSLYVDGLGAAANYTEMMSHNTCAIVNGLGGECEPFEP